MPYCDTKIDGKTLRRYTVITPYRQYGFSDLPKSKTLETWESEYDTWIKINGEFANLSEFCTVGVPKLGKLQMASDCETTIVAIDGEIFRVLSKWM